MRKFIVLIVILLASVAYSQQISYYNIGTEVGAVSDRYGNVHDGAVAVPLNGTFELPTPTRDRTLLMVTYGVWHDSTAYVTGKKPVSHLTVTFEDSLFYSVVTPATLDTLAIQAAPRLFDVINNMGGTLP